MPLSSVGRVLEARYYFLSLIYALSIAALVPVTYDDTLPNPLGGPKIKYKGGWFNSANCSGCIPGLDESSMIGKTWHAHFFDSLGIPPETGMPVPSSNRTGSAFIVYQGSAIYVYCTLLRAQATNIRFSLDGPVVGNFMRAPTNSSGFDYNVLVYANTTTHHGTHHLLIENGVNSDQSALIFDSITYTHGSSSTTERPRLPTAAIAGIVISVTVVLALLILGVLLYRRRKMRQDKSQGLLGPSTYNNLAVTPYYPGSSSLNGMHLARGKLRGFTIRRPYWLRQVDEVPVVEAAPPAYSSNRLSWGKSKPPPPPTVTNG